MAFFASPNLWLSAPYQAGYSIVVETHSTSQADSVGGRAKIRRNIIPQRTSTMGAYTMIIMFLNLLQFSATWGCLVHQISGPAIKK
jgi:hypothetical protein